MERLPNRYPKISQSHKVPLYKGLSLFYPKLMKKPLCAMPLRYVSVVLNYQGESPPISHWDRVVIPQGWAVASWDIGGAV